MSENVIEKRQVAISEYVQFIQGDRFKRNYVFANDDALCLNQEIIHLPKVCFVLIKKKQYIKFRQIIM